MNKTKIEWCDSTWNPVTGCLHGCEYCYASKIANRFGCGMNVPHVLCEPIKSNGRVQSYPLGFTPTFSKKGKLPERANIWYGSTATSSDKQLYLSSNRNTFLNIEPILKDFGTNIKFYKLFDWVIIGAETGNRRYKVIPEKEWIGNICKAANESRIPVFMKDSLIPIVGEENMRREFPWESGYIV